MTRLTTPITRAGAFIDLRVGVSSSRERILKIANKVVPASVIVRALIDTGASCTCIDAGTLRGLGLTPASTVLMHSSSTSGTAHTSDVYEVSLAVDRVGTGISRGIAPVIAIDLSGQGQSFLGLVGRDVLDMCVLIYDGPSRIATLKL